MPTYQNFKAIYLLKRFLVYFDFERQGLCEQLDSERYTNFTEKIKKFLKQIELSTIQNLMSERRIDPLAHKLLL